MKKSLLLAILALSGCQTASFISDKDAWVSIKHFGSDTVYYCERVPVDKNTIPVCTEAIIINDWKNTRYDYDQMYKHIKNKKKLREKISQDTESEE